MTTSFFCCLSPGRYAKGVSDKLYSSERKHNALSCLCFFSFVFAGCMMLFATSRKVSKNSCEHIICSTFIISLRAPANDGPSPRYFSSSRKTMHFRAHTLQTRELRIVCMFGPQHLFCNVITPFAPEAQGSKHMVQTKAAPKPKPRFSSSIRLKIEGLRPKDKAKADKLLRNAWLQATPP